MMRPATEQVGHGCSRRESAAAAMAIDYHLMAWKKAAIIELLVLEDQVLLICQDAFLVLKFCLDIIMVTSAALGEGCCEIESRLVTTNASCVCEVLRDIH